MTSSKRCPNNATGLILLIGTQKGLFLARATPERRAWALEGPFIPGYEIAHAWLDPRKPETGYAAANHPVWGSHVYRTQGYGKSWESVGRAPHHAPGLYEQQLRALWHLAPGPASEPDVLYAGIDPAGLFVSRDAGEHWSPITGLNHHPTRNTWEPARGGFAVHSIRIDPHDPKRIYAAVSAGGAFRSDDEGRTWKPINRGVRAENLPLEQPETGHNIHRLLLHPARSTRLYRQCYNGTYRSDDRGDNWTEITAGLPSDFGYGIAVDPSDPDTVFVIPEQSSDMRAVVDGRLRVFRSTTAGQHWEPLLDGLPQQHVYATVLREALASDGLDPCGVYFGTSGGHLFASRDRGEHWELIAAFLPRILSIKAALV
ncbi:MAG: WD40/YVTN/BNR-like repeat-containing protein [Gammaproteobacteria bacterium]